MDATTLLWQALRDFDGALLEHAIREGADLTSVKYPNGGPTPLEHLAHTHLRHALQNKTKHQQHRAIEKILLKHPSPYTTPQAFHEHGILFHALFHQTVAFHDEDDCSQCFPTVDHMTHWLGWAKQQIPPATWHKDAADAWRSFLELYGQDSEGQACELPMVLATPMLAMLLNAGVPASVLDTEDTFRFAFSVHFPELKSQALAEARAEQLEGMAASASRRPSRPRG